MNVTVLSAGPVPDALLNAIVSMAAMDHAHLPGALPRPLPANGSGPDPTQVCLESAFCSSAPACMLGHSSKATQLGLLPLPLSVSPLPPHGLTALVGASMSYDTLYEKVLAALAITLI